MKLANRKNSFFCDINDASRKRFQISLDDKTRLRLHIQQTLPVKVLVQFTLQKNLNSTILTKHFPESLFIFKLHIYMHIFPHKLHNARSELGQHLAFFMCFGLRNTTMNHQFFKIWTSFEQT